MAAAMPVQATTAMATGTGRNTLGSLIEPGSVQLLFADLRSPLVAGSRTQQPDCLERAAAVLAEVGTILSLPMLFSVVMEGSLPPHLLPALKPYSRKENTLLRRPVARFHDLATVAAIAAIVGASW